MCLHYPQCNLNYQQFVGHFGCVILFIYTVHSYARSSECNLTPQAGSRGPAVQQLSICITNTFPDQLNEHILILSSTQITLHLISQPEPLCGHCISDRAFPRVTCVIEPQPLLPPTNQTEPDLRGSV